MKCGIDDRSLLKHKSPQYLLLTFQKTLLFSLVCCKLVIQFRLSSLLVEKDQLVNRNHNVTIMTLFLLVNIVNILLYNLISSLIFG